MSDNPNVEPGPNYGTPPNGTPPEWPYGTPPPSYGTDEPPARPLPLGEAIRQLPDQYIKVLTKPGAAVFAREQGKAAWDITWVQIIILGVIQALVGLVVFSFTVPNSLANSHVPAQTIQIFKAFSGAFSLGFLILTPIFFFIGVGIYHLIAKAFGGRGTFLAYGYSYLLFAVPLTLISGIISTIVSVLGLPPFMSSLLSLVVSIYHVVLQVFMTMAVHRLSGGKATLATLLLPIVLFVLFLALVVFIAISAFSATHPH